VTDFSPRYVWPRGLSFSLLDQVFEKFRDLRQLWHHFTRPRWDFT